MKMEFIHGFYIDVYWHTDETKKLCDSGMGYDIKSLTTRKVILYTIHAIQPYKLDDGTWCCQIYSGNDEWLAPYTMIEVAKQIEQYVKNTLFNLC